MTTPLSGSYFCGVCPRRADFPSWPALVRHATARHQETGTCDYCGRHGRVNLSGTELGEITSRWCPDTDACDARLDARLQAGVPYTDGRDA